MDRSYRELFGFSLREGDQHGAELLTTKHTYASLNIEISKKIEVIAPASGKTCPILQ
jgi:hypothetical protein